MHTAVLLAATLFASSFPTSTLSARELSGRGVSTDRAWLIERAGELATTASADPAESARLESLVRDAALKAHAQAQQTRSVDDYEHTLALYDLYLDTWFDADPAYNLAFYRAELLWDLGDWEAAALGYHAVVRVDRDGRFTLDAAWNELLAWQRQASAQVAGDKAELLGGDVVLCRPPEVCGRATSERVVVGVHRNVLEAADRFVLLAGGNDDPRRERERAVAAFKAFSVLARHDVADEAKARVKELLRMEGAFEFAAPAVRILVDKTAQWQGDAAAEQLACSFWQQPKLRADANTRAVLAASCRAH